jgi:hypothetical protein
MKNKVVLFTSVGFILLSTSLFSQQVRVGRQSLNSLGSSTVSNGVRISHTAGQASSTSVSKSGNLVIRQGFQQANVMQYEVEKTDFTVQLFPNPNDGNFNVSLVGCQDNEVVTYQVIDINGKIIQESNASTPSSFTVSVPSIESGIYYLILNSTSGKGASVKFNIQ